MEVVSIVQGSLVDMLRYRIRYRHQYIVNIFVSISNCQCLHLQTTAPYLVIDNMRLNRGMRGGMIAESRATFNSATDSKLPARQGDVDKGDSEVANSLSTKVAGNRTFLQFANVPTLNNAGLYLKTCLALLCTKLTTSHSKPRPLAINSRAAVHSH